MINDFLKQRPSQMETSQDMKNCRSPVQKKIFKESDLKNIFENPMPKHIAIIMDGNRRWAQKKFLSSIVGIKGHQTGASRLVEIVSASLEIGVEVLTVFAFSTENWSRPQVEIDWLLVLFENYLTEQAEKMKDQGIRFCVIGDRCKLPQRLQNEISRAEELTAMGTSMDFVIALNYGGRSDIARACRKIARLCMGQSLQIEEITEDLISRHLDTKDFKDPDLLIRTGGEKRISNFLLWQTAYTELYLSEVMWPDFSPKELLNAIVSYQSRQRRKGC